MKKLLLILFAIVLIASLLRVPFEGTVSTHSGSEGPSDDPGDDSVLASWHDFGDCVATCLKSNVCESCSREYTEDELSMLTFQTGESFSFGSMELYQCNCMSSIYCYSIHCFINGVCHECGYACSHIPTEYDQHYLRYLPVNHELRDYTEYFDSYHYYLTNLGSFVENGECKLCRMPVEG